MFCVLHFFATIRYFNGAPVLFQLGDLACGQ